MRGERAYKPNSLEQWDIRLPRESQSSGALMRADQPQTNHTHRIAGLEQFEPAGLAGSVFLQIDKVIRWKSCLDGNTKSLDGLMNNTLLLRRMRHCFHLGCAIDAYTVPRLLL